MSKPKWPTEDGTYLLVELYGLNIWLFTEEKPYQKAMKCIHGESDDSKVCGLTTYSVHKDGTNIFAVGVFDGDSSTLVHELAHVTLFACEHLGFEAEEGNGEPFAYLMEFLYTNFLPTIMEIKDEDAQKDEEETKEKA